MAIYTVFFVREDALVPDFELGDFGTVDDALRGAGEMVRQYGPILRAEILSSKPAGRGVVPAATFGSRRASTSAWVKSDLAYRAETAA